VIASGCTAGAERFGSYSKLATLATFLILIVGFSAFAQDNSVGSADSVAVATVAPVTSLVVEDHRYDDGENLALTWVPSIDDQPVGGKVIGYEVYQIIDAGEPEKIADVLPGVSSYLASGLHSGSSYQFYVMARSETASAPSSVSAALSPHREWINWGLWNLMLTALVVGGSVMFFIETARRGHELFVRKIAGLEAVDEAIGRATEMGRPILYIPGIRDMDDVQTLASLTILGRVAEHAATYDVKIRMPVSRSLVMTAARETIKAACQAAGRPDAYNEDMVNYVTDEQFGYVAAVDGIMVRERPATVFLLGAFFAESLILAETGNSVGAIQIAGTARPAQLPFFIAACDFTLIGEELFAASAYLSGEPKSLGSLKGQDVGKGVAMVAIVLGVVAATLYALTGAAWLQAFGDWLVAMFTIAS